MCTAGFRFSWRKMELATEDIDRWRQVVCNLCSTGSDMTYVKSSYRQITFAICIFIGTIT